MQRLLGAVGVESFVKDKARCQTNDDCKVTTLRLRRAGADRFADRVGFLSERKSKQLAAVVSRPHSNAYKPMTWDDEVVAVTPCFVVPVDIQVEGSVFTAMNLVSHNSWLKPLEYAALGVPCVTADMPEYRRLGVGIQASKPKHWKAALIKLMTDEQARSDVVAHGLETAAQWTYEARADQWWDAWTG